MIRGDLLSLTPDALAALANRGLVKRAAKDLDAGNGPEITVSPGGDVDGTFPDGTRTSLPTGAGLEAAACSCAATGTCRHRICLVLAYQRTGPVPAGSEPAAPGTAWSPGTFDDDALARVLGQRAITAARRTLRAGYSARIRRPTEADPVARAELPACTVRFLVPDELGYVDTDAAAAVRGEVTVLAVWAFRAADERGLTGGDTRLDIGGAAEPAGTAAGGLGAALDLADQILLEGAAHAGPVLAAAVERVAADLTAAGLHWPAAALDDLAAQLAAHHDRRADHDPARIAELLAEVHARHRAVHPGAARAGGRSQVLGTDESAQTPLRRVRLAALGCRVGGTPRSRTADIYLAHTGTGIVLVLKRRWDVPDGETLTGADLAGRRILGSPLRSLAAANVVSESATRSAGRLVRVAAGRIAKTTVTPLGDAWGGLPAGLLVRDLEAEGRALDALPPRLVRPRVQAELARVIEIAEVRDIGYHPGAQRLEAVVADAAGTRAVVSADYSPHRPAALDALADALAAAPRHISGTIRRDRGGLLIDPLALQTTTVQTTTVQTTTVQTTTVQTTTGRSTTGQTADGVVVPDLTPGEGTAALGAAPPPVPDPLARALGEALAACAETAHCGLPNSPPGLRARIAQAAGDLEGLGLRTTAGTLRAFATALSGDDPRRLTRTWATAHIRLLTAAELR